MSLPALANTTQDLNLTPDQDWQAQRDAYRQALELLSKGQRSEFDKAAEKLRDYPLYPDLKFREYSRYIDAVSQKQIDDFIEQFGDSVLALRMRREWIQSLADQKDWQHYLEQYRPGQYDSHFDCYYYWGQYKVGSRDDAFAGARKLWLVGKSQDNACDPLFEVWQTTGQIDGDLAWERMRLAIHHREMQLARHLESFLASPTRQKMAREWRDLYRDPRRLKAISRYQAWGDAAKPLLMTGFSRLIRKDSDLALQLWPQYEQAFHFNTDEKQEMLGDFAYALALNQDPNAEYWLDQAAQYPDNDYLAPIAMRNALRDHDWVRVRCWLALIDPDDDDAPEWRYWTARADRHVGRIDPARMPRIHIDRHRVDVLSFNSRFLSALYNKDDIFTLMPLSVLKAKFPPENPDTTLRELAGERHFYGFLASEILRQPLQLNLYTNDVSKQQLQEMANRPGVQRARELYLMGDVYQSQLEWHYMIGHMSAQDRSVAAHLAYYWTWNNAAIVAAARSTAHDNLKIRFPTAFQGSITQYANDEGIAPDWVYSVIRQESAFSPTAHSPVGALGMMQLMPRTARHLAQQMQIETPSRNDLLEPDANIRMGTYYLKQLLDKFDGNIILATAAYNAGVSRARSWQPKYTSMAGDIWVETIPYRETRNYVKNILTYQAIYRHHLGLDVSMTTALASIPPRQPDTTAER